jgi:hypothetical protein
MIMGVDMVINGFVDASLKRIRAFLLASGFDRLRPEKITSDFFPNLQLGFFSQVLKRDIHKRFSYNLISPARSTFLAAAEKAVGCLALSRWSSPREERP